MGIRNITESEVRKIHEKSLYILENVGVDFEEPEVLKLFKDRGIRVEGQRVYFDAATVENAMKSAVSSFELTTPYGSLKIGDGGVAFSSASGARNVLRDGRVSPSQLQDFIDGRKLDDTSKVVNLLCGPFIQIEGLAPEKTALVKTALTLKYSKKPMITFCDTKEHAEASIDFVKKFYGTDEGYFCIGVGNVISPLRYGKDDVEAILTYTRRNLPVVIACCSMPGMTSPITVGGTIVQNNAEVLAGLVMTQLVNPGAPVVYGNVTFSSDMRKAVPVSWGPEVGVFMEYAKAMASFYGVPCRTGGALPSSKDIDWQDGAETAISLMSTFDCKADFVLHCCSELDCLNIFSMEKFVLDDELMEARLSVENRNFLSDEAINIESIEEVGPGGNYLLEEDTLALYRSELFLPELFNTEAYNSWESSGKPSVLEKAKIRVQQRLEQYVQPKYEKWQEEMLEEVLSDVMIPG